MIAPFVQLPAVGHLPNFASLPRLPFKSELYLDADEGAFGHLLAYSNILLSVISHFFPDHIKAISLYCLTCRLTLQRMVYCAAIIC